MPYIEDQGTLNGVFERVTEDPLLSKQNAKYIEAHIEFLKAKQSNIRTQIKHLYHIRRFYRLLKNPKRDFKQLTRENMQTAMAEMEGTAYGSETKRNIKVVVKYFWKHLKGDDEFYPQEVRWIKTSGDKKNRKMPEDLLTEDEIKRMIETGLKHDLTELKMKLAKATKKTYVVVPNAVEEERYGKVSSAKVVTLSRWGAEA
jgi:site-specific recombinase XerD